MGCLPINQVLLLHNGRVVSSRQGIAFHTPRAKKCSAVGFGELCTETTLHLCPFACLIPCPASPRGLVNGFTRVKFVCRFPATDIWGDKVLVQTTGGANYTGNDIERLLLDLFLEQQVSNR